MVWPIESAGGDRYGFFKATTAAADSMIRSVGRGILEILERKA